MSDGYKQGLPHQCGDVAGPGIVGRDLSERQTSNCHECCSTDVCNSYLCKHQKPTTCIDDESVDCAKMNSLFQICQNTHQASLVCPKFCHLCNLVDGNWAQWSLWSRCDVTSDKGVQTRSRTCTNPAPVNGGHDCPGGASETKVCQDVCPGRCQAYAILVLACHNVLCLWENVCACFFPFSVYGGWSKWSSWGSCSVSCDVGMQRRDRSCSNPYPSHSGDHCFGESRDDRICTPRACSDGNWSSWGSWEACSESCGGGVRSRPRTCTNPRPSLVGRYCDGSPEQVTSCNNKPCPVQTVFFTANSIIRGSNPLIFSTVLYNDGGGYNSSTGKFTCPLAGVYNIATTLTKEWFYPTGWVTCFININSSEKIGGDNRPYNTDEKKGSYTETLVGTFYLAKNDIVYIHCNRVNNRSQTRPAYATKYNMGLNEIGVVLALSYMSVVPPAESLSCYSCQTIDDPLTCNKTATCSGTQVCFQEVKGGIYNMGCIEDHQCGGVAGPGIVGRDLAERQLSSCHECCSTDGCNSDICKHSKPSTCVDDESVDCARMNSLFHVCQDVHQASLVCPKFCHLCTLVDGNWAEWSPWSGCDVTCGNGIQTRSRTCTNPAPANGGLDCLGSAAETKVCQKELCPVHGAWSIWTAWGSCSVSCGVGIQRRDRSCSNPYPSRAGDHCFGESRDDRICIPGACADGGWSSWGSWGTCSASCGDGMQSRLRTCTNPRPSLLGRYCDGSPEQVTMCNNKPCTDGGWSSWGSWGTCSASCGDGVQSRLRTCTNPRPSLLGRYCDGSPEQVTMCNNKPCPVVAFTAIGASGSSPLIFPTVLYNDGSGYSSNTGKFTCPLAGIYNFAATITKNYGDDISYINCVLNINSIIKVGGYSDPYGSNGDKGANFVMISGTFHLNRNDVVYIGCEHDASHLHGSYYSSFTGFLVTPDNCRVQEKLVDTAAPRNLITSSNNWPDSDKSVDVWTVVSKVLTSRKAQAMGSCELATLLILIRIFVVPAESLICFSCQTIDDPLTCNKTSTCIGTQVCFLDVQNGIYKMGCIEDQQCGGIAGPGIVGRDLVERQSSNCHECCSTDACNFDLCKHQKPTACVDDETVDCAKMNSLFHVCQDIHQAKLVCPKFCHLCTLVDGNWAQWSPWSGCDVTCGNGVQTRSRTCTHPAPANGGLDCSGNGTETKVCKKDVCPVHGGWSTWSSWGSCSVSCDVGMQRRDRTCSNPYPSLTGDHCFGSSIEDQICMPGACSDGNWSSWGSWGACSTSCGNGVQSRLRSCTNPRPSLLGRYCDGSPEHIASCNKKPCPALKVAFTVVSPRVDSSLVRFTYVHYNKGGGYNSSTGKFTCPHAGVYNFAATITKDSTSVDSLRCYLYLNVQVKVAAFESSHNKDESYSVTMSGTFHLNINDNVFVLCEAGYTAISIGVFSSFTGFLVSPDY
ncbi:uncharacterized protein LOC123538063 [Mercenaria mercenaria]|uniref:uncharacterized protein LOC123538063 n=1 Tax=Mercenaria mercenaria TaxID=6596 RepID=UPI00234E9E64|nr:uncharacterized protein LOC123538063 [Mercenaria mercenaria]